MLVIAFRKSFTVRSAWKINFQSRSALNYIIHDHICKEKYSLQDVCILMAIHIIYEIFVVSAKLKEILVEIQSVTKIYIFYSIFLITVLFCYFLF